MKKFDENKNITEEYKNYVSNLKREDLEVMYIGADAYVDRLNNVLNELEKYSKDNIKVLENRLSTPFCNFEKATKELMIHNFYLDKLKELKESDK